ncbi:MAG: tetratricopeptide repeat protein [Terriglobia bacterium]
MDAEVYPQNEVSNFINQNFVPVKIHIKEHPKDFERFKADWTPTVIVSEPDGTERYRFSGFLPADDFLAELRLGLAKAAFSRGEYDAAAKGFRETLEKYPQSGVAAEAMYWAGASDYKATGKPDHLREAGQQLQARFPDSPWAKKGSVWVQ